MRYELLPSRVVGGRITAPGSKSFSQRAVLAAMLARGVSRLWGITECGDSSSAVELVRSCGCVVRNEAESLVIDSSNYSGLSDRLFIGESALLVRMVSVLAALDGRAKTIDGAGSVLGRDMSQLIDMLRVLGVKVESQNNRLPLSIGGVLSSGRYVVDGSKSSQIISGLLMALPMCSGDSEVVVENLVSRPYVEMTLKLLASFGIKIIANESKFEIAGNQHYQPVDYAVEGDWSSAAPFLAMAAMRGKIEVANLRADSLQADYRIVDIIKSVGADVEFIGDLCRVTPPQSVELSPFSVDLTDAPDLFPVAAALAANCSGVSLLKGTLRLGNKESDRVMSTKQMVEQFGAVVDCSQADLMRIIPGVPNQEIIVNSYSDHRIVMAAAVAAVGAERSVLVSDAECVAKSYPNFLSDLRRVVE